MKASFFALLALSACAVNAHAQIGTTVYRAYLPGTDQSKQLVIDASDLFEPGMTDTATKVFGYPGKRMGLDSAAEPRRVNIEGLERDTRNGRAWGLSVGVERGAFTLRLAHQNRNVAKVAPATPMGNRIDARNSVVAFNLDLGPATAYAAYSANRGWGSSPLWNPDNPYGAAMASTPSTDSRDILMGLAVPRGATTFLVSFIRKNDRDLANRDADQIAFGATYRISRKTDFYTAFSHIQHRGQQMGLQLDGGKGSSALNVGMRHSF